MFWAVEPAPRGIWKLFDGYDNAAYGGYGQYNYGSYYPQYRPRHNSGRSYSEGGGNRYKAICRVHAGDAEAFPGRIANPVCPY